MKAKQVTALLLTALITSTVACGSETPPAETTASDSTSTETTALDALAERAAVSDGLPVKNYGEETFTIATDIGSEWIVIQDESTGDVIDDAIYKRNLAIEERFKVKLNCISDEYKEILKKVTSMVQAGDNEIDLCMTHVVASGEYSMNNIFLNWYDVPNVDFSKPWWSESTVNDLTVNGVCLLAVGDFALTALARTYCMFYNQQLADEYKVGDLYQIANDGKWTVDRIKELSKDVYVDLNSNSAIDGEDRFGYITTVRSALNAYLWSFGGKVLSKDQNGDIKLVYHNEKTGEMVAKLCSLFFDNDGIYNNSKEPTYSYLFALDAFKSDRALFINANIGNAVNELRDMEADYGILPYPKWDENQDRYYTMVDGSHHVLAVPVTVSDPERTGIITEALCAESYKQVVPAYYETALKTKYTRDDESIAMIDMIVNSRVFDLGYVYDGWKGASFIFQNLISNNNPNFESEWASKESAVTTYYQSVIDYFENYYK